MRKVIYSMSVSLDGYIAGPDGSFDWSAPSPELHRFHNERVREVGVQLLGRALYETMLYWETPEPTESGDEIEREFAAIWRALPRIVFSTTLTEVQGSASLATESVVEEVQRLKAEPGKDIAVGGAALAGSLIEQDLVDEYHPFVYPVLVGGGTPYFPPGASQKDLELVETRMFGPVVSLRYRRGER
jgi:dihydrofolate reductase